MEQVNVHNLKENKTYGVILVALFAAIMVVCSQISVPIGPVPINLGLLGVFIAAGLLPPLKAVLSQVVFILLGLVGLPVFAGFKGGFGVLAGPTGGYIIGYILAAFAISIILTVVRKKQSLSTVAHIIWCVISIIVGVVLCYALGTAWFVISTGNTVAQALAVCVIPFIAGDIVKTALATILIVRLKRFV